MSGSSSSVVTNRDRDCLACRLTSGLGLIGAGLYVAYHSKNFNRKPGKTIMFTVASVIVALGSARALDLPPFHKQLNHQARTN